jgi:hypothetical protein
VGSGCRLTLCSHESYLGCCDGTSKRFRQQRLQLSSESANIWRTVFSLRELEELCR